MTKDEHCTENIPKILDATCGLKEMWFDKKDIGTVYLDRRIGFLDIDLRLRKKDKQVLEPSICADNRFLPFRDDVFELVLFDPPHRIRNTVSGIVKIYDVLKPDSYVKDIYLATREMSRVLRKGGFLVFKWNIESKELYQILSIFPKQLKQLFFTKGDHYSSSKKYKTTSYTIVFRNDK